MSNENKSVEYLKVIADIIETELDLKPTGGSTNPLLHRVFLYNQDFILPTYDYMFVILSENPGKIIASTNRYIGTGVLSNELQEVIIQKEVMIDIFSKNSEARERKEEILMALSSNYCQEQQEMNGFRVFAYSTRFIDLSENEAGSRLNRYQASIMVHCRYSKQKAIDNFAYFENEITEN